MRLAPGHSAPEAPSKRRLRAVEDDDVRRSRQSPPGVRGPRFGDALSRGVLALSATLLAGASGLWMLIAGKYGFAALMLLGLATIFGATYLGLLAQAITRGKTVEYWEDRRELRWELSRQEAYSRLLLISLEAIGDLRNESDRELPVEEAFQKMIDAAHRVFASAHDDLAVLLAYQVGDRCEVVCSTLTPGSRWRELRSGKRCYIEGNLERKLRELDPNHHSRPITTYSESLARRGTLWLVTLPGSPLQKKEKDLFESLLSHFDLIADYWSPTLLGKRPGHLQAIG
jgi:hypothetical protein